MKGLKMFGRRALSGCLFLITTTAFVVSSQAQVSVTNNNSFIELNPNSTAGMYTWTVDGVDQLYQQWFWWRIGDAGGEQGINAIGAPTISRPSANRLSLLYANGIFSVQVNYTLNGGAAGSGAASMGQTIRIVSYTNAPLSLHFFDYADFDLDNTIGGQDATISGLYQVVQNLGPRLVTHTVSPGATHAEANSFANTLNSLNDVNPTTLNDVMTVGSTDATWAFQWDLNIAANGSQLFSMTYQVPEPTMFAFGALGLLAWATLRRRNQ